MDTAGALETSEYLGYVESAEDIAASRLSEEADQDSDHRRPIETLLDIIEDVRRRSSIINLSLDDFRDLLPDKKSISRCSVNELREIKATATLRSSAIDKADPRLKYYDAIKLYLEAEERSRPIEEQFPHVRTDMDEFDRRLDKMTASLDKLFRESANESDQMELAVRKLLGRYLESIGWEYWDVGLREGRIFQKKGTAIAQWDGVIGAKRDDELCIFLVETKRIPHANDIFRDDDINNGKSMFVRGIKTMEYFNLLRNKDIEGQFGSMLEQDLILKLYINARVVFVYASQTMNEAAKNRIRLLPAMFVEQGHSVDVYLMECLSPSEGNVVKVD